MDERTVLDDVLKILRRLEEIGDATDEMYATAAANAVSLVKGLRRKYNTGSPCEWGLNGYCVTCGGSNPTDCFFTDLDTK